MASTRRCVLAPRWADCIVHHWLPCLPGSRGSGVQFSAYCPACQPNGGRHRRLSLTAGRTCVLYRCHHDPPCSQAAVREALIRAGVTCLSRVQHRRPASDQFRDRILALLDEPMSAPAFRFRAAMAAWECDARMAADRLKIPRRTYYRLLYPSAKNGTEPQVGTDSTSARNGTVARSTRVPEMARHRRSAPRE
jgi:hypothetical protein